MANREPGSCSVYMVTPPPTPPHPQDHTLYLYIQAYMTDTLFQTPHLMLSFWSLPLVFFGKESSLPYCGSHFRAPWAMASGGYA